VPVESRNFDPPRPTSEQLRDVLRVALVSRQQAQPRALSTYEPLAWLLREDVGNRAVRRARRALYRRLVTDLAREFSRIYSERLLASNGPWDFPDVYIASEQARKCIRRMRWCAFQHMLGFSAAGDGSVRMYRAVMELLGA
jgi:hypothetical protein